MTQVVDEQERQRIVIESLQEPEGDPSQDLLERTLLQVHAEITARDIVGFATAVFLLRFCAPILDMLAAPFASTSREEEE